MDLETVIRKKLKEKKILLMTHVVVGYPSIEDNIKMLKLMDEANIDLVELQMPFSEPTADGPLFVKANQEAIKKGIKIKNLIYLMNKASKENKMEILMMGYCNTAFKMGYEKFVNTIKNNGAKGFILPDLPLEEYNELFKLSIEYNINPILLCTPTNTNERLKKILNHARGFVYCVARKGVTGEKTSVNNNVEEFLKRCKNFTDLPLALGFGISSKNDIEKLKGKAEIAIVGSALLNSWEKGGFNLYKDHLFSLSESRN